MKVINASALVLAIQVLAIAMLLLMGVEACFASTRFSKSAGAFSEPWPGLNAEETLNFVVGKAVFDKIWVFAPSSTTASDGLGPLYNARSCHRCHKNNGRGQSPVNQLGPQGSKNYRPVSLFVRLSIPPQTETHHQLLQQKRLGFIPEPVYGSQLQIFAYPGGKAEGQLQVTYRDKVVLFSDGEKIILREPSYNVNHLGYGQLHDQVMLSPRMTPMVFGMGGLEILPEQVILAREDVGDRDNDGISGRANRVWDESRQKVSIGRFGWKAGSPSLDQQNNAALKGDIGIGNWLFNSPYGDCSSLQVSCLSQPTGNSKHLQSLEAAKSMTDALLRYMTNLSVPENPQTNSKGVKTGEQLFNRLGCENCHRAKYTLPSNLGPVFSSKEISPYTDLLLHDMGPELADNRPEFDASGSEWRTPPLWAIGLTRRISGEENYLHDGRARTLMEAIVWHGGEAQTSKNRVLALSKSERLSLIQFLKSL